MIDLKNRKTFIKAVMTKHITYRWTQEKIAILNADFKGTESRKRQIEKTEYLFYAGT